MTFVSHDSTPNQGLSATSQAPRESGGSQKILEIRDASRLSRNSPVKKRVRALRQFEKLKRLRQQRQLSDCLEFLSERGIQGDVAIFILGQLGGES